MMIILQELLIINIVAMALYAIILICLIVIKASKDEIITATIIWFIAMIILDGVVYTIP